MKKAILLLAVLILMTSNISFAQEGRPQYKIRNERAGEYIGDIIIELFPYVAPLHVANFDSLVSISFYDSTAWHRVVPDFVIQGGDPNSKHGPRDTWGYGDSTQATVPAEFSKVSHLTGIIGAARELDDINSASSQFYINTFDNPFLDGDYTAYGIVVEGMDVAYDIESSPRDAIDNPHEKIEMFITRIGLNESIPGIPELISPDDNVTAFTLDTNFVWTPVEDAVLYMLEIARDTAFTDIALRDSFEVMNGNIVAKIREIELGEKKFFWRVRANNGAKFGEYSEIRRFTTSIAPPVLLFPPDSSTGVTINPLLLWEEAEGANSYRLQMVKAFPTFDPLRLIVDEAGLTSTEFQLNGLENNRRYYWRVLTETDDYDSPYSPVYMFTTEDISDFEDENLPQEISLEQNYPNPFNPNTKIKFSIPSVTKITQSVSTKLVLYDLLGQEVKTILNEKLVPGIYEVEVDGSNLPSGVYLYKLTSGNYSQTKKMVLIK
ncbi:MAG: peptidylprolyl isomerase [Melioribacteraceae bacterium]|nr:peptidylprolyl isomerase [Melioribacteraceae bacterium]